MCLVAAHFGARLPIAATVGTLPTACSLGFSLPSSPTSAADTSHPADVPRFPFCESSLLRINQRYQFFFFVRALSVPWSDVVHEGPMDKA